jgi:hypothetical protein
MSETQQVLETQQASGEKARPAVTGAVRRTPHTPVGPTQSGPHLPQIIVFKAPGFNGDFRIFSAPAPDAYLYYGFSYVGDDWNDKIYSVIVLSGIWQFFEYGGFAPPNTYTQLGPGWYASVKDPCFGPYNSISSILCVNHDQGDLPYNDFLGGR